MRLLKIPRFDAFSLFGGLLVHSSDKGIHAWTVERFVICEQFSFVFPKALEGRHNVAQRVNGGKLGQ